MPRKNFLDDQKIFSVLKARHEQPVGCVLHARRSYADGGTTRAGAELVLHLNFFAYKLIFSLLYLNPYARLA
jgi:hypothetical protein